MSSHKLIYKAPELAQTKKKIKIAVPYGYANPSESPLAEDADPQEIQKIVEDLILHLPDNDDQAEDHPPHSPNKAKGNQQSKNIDSFKIADKGDKPEKGSEDMEKLPRDSAENLEIEEPQQEKKDKMPAQDQPAQSAGDQETSKKQYSEIDINHTEFSNKDEPDIKQPEQKSKTTGMAAGSNTRADEVKQKMENEEKKVSENKHLVTEAKNEATKIIQKAKQEAEEIISQAEQAVIKKDQEWEIQKKEALTTEINQAQEKGYESGKKEIKRLVQQIGNVLARAIKAKEKIILESEQQMVDLILLIARRIIRDEYEERKELVTANVKRALTRIKSKGEIDVRLNINDLQLTSEKKDEFMAEFSQFENIHFYEDPTIEPGGCIIETRTGSIDARVETQLTKIEHAIRATQSS